MTELQVSCLPLGEGSVSLVVPVLPSIHSLQQTTGCAALRANVPLICQGSKSRVRSIKRQVQPLDSEARITAGPRRRLRRLLAEAGAPHSHCSPPGPSPRWVQLAASVLRAEVCCIPSLSDTYRQCRCSHSSCSWLTHTHTHTHGSPQCSQGMTF